ncbi:MAG: chemotaxis protein CheW [Syntrophobacteraceae bacterium]
MSPEGKDALVREGPRAKEPAGFPEQEGQRCWERIGVWGSCDERCPRLPEVIHCRNCGIYIEEGRSLLEGAQNEQYLNRWTEVMASGKEEGVQAAIRVLVFRLGDQWLALHSGVFAEVIELVRPHGVPHRTNSIFKGLVNVHGELQLCVSLKGLLEIEGQGDGQEKQTVYKRMVVIQREGQVWVFPVDEIHGIHRVDPQSLQNIPVGLSRTGGDYCRAIFEWEGKSVVFLDEALVFDTLGRSFP